MEVKTKILDPKKCVRWAFSDRSDFEFGDLAALARDIKTNGQIEPVIARPAKGRGIDFEIIAGSRRWKVCLESGLPLLAMVKELSDLEALHHQIKENEKEPLSDYSIGMNIKKLTNEKNFSVREIARLMSFSKTKINNLLAFSKVPPEIWATVENMSKVSSRCAGMIYTLSNKGDEYIEALKDVAEEIRKGAGANKIQALVERIVHGDDTEIEYQKKIVGKDGSTIGFWNKQGIVFEKGAAIDQKKIEQAIIRVMS